VEGLQSIKVNDFSIFTILDAVGMSEQKHCLPVPWNLVLRLGQRSFWQCIEPKLFIAREEPDSKWFSMTVEFYSHAKSQAARSFSITSRVD